MKFTASPFLLFNSTKKLFFRSDKRETGQGQKRDGTTRDVENINRKDQDNSGNNDNFEKETWQWKKNMLGEKTYRKRKRKQSTPWLKSHKFDARYFLSPFFNFVIKDLTYWEKRRKKKKLFNWRNHGFNLSEYELHAIRDPSCAIPFYSTNFSSLAQDSTTCRVCCSIHQYIHWSILFSSTV